MEGVSQAFRGAFFGEKAYALIGQKIKAAQLLYGDEVSSALVDDPGDSSLVSEDLRGLVPCRQKGRISPLVADSLTLRSSKTSEVW